MARDADAHRLLAELLLRGDLTGVPVDDLVTAIKTAMVEMSEREAFIKRGLAALNQQGMTFDVIAQRVGITRSKANRWAKDYM